MKLTLTRRGLAVAVALLTAAGTLSACGSGGSDGKTIRVVYQKFGVGIQLDAHFQKIKKEFETANPGLKVTLVPVNASENDYYTKVSLMQKSASTAPDVVYEDSFLINSDIQAGYLRPLDDYLAKWSDWSQFLPAAQGAARGQDGKTYGVPTDTDTRGLWYNKQLFAKAGLPTDWQPKTWDDVLAAARTIKAKLAGVTPLNVFAGKPAGASGRACRAWKCCFTEPVALFTTPKRKNGSRRARDSLTRWPLCRPSTNKASVQRPSRRWIRTVPE
ncbi:ABC transporter substrate-binding protein [Fodinicola feengrottensis]|uniref:ABC transporter substrate-binding protein n=1 Tax=Fodinicola feengrottensis TaxID=435914 RepID=UPI002441BF9A|nr:extracellular solute-binding protein [Fodinicola feengrottensis]